MLALLTLRCLRSLYMRNQIADSHGVANEDETVTGQMDRNLTSVQASTGSTTRLPQPDCDDERPNPLQKVDALQMKFLRLVRRMGMSPNNEVVAHVLQRLQLADLVRSGESNRCNSGINEAQIVGAEQETVGQANNSDFQLKILLLGKTGVGKSATVNSLFNERKAAVDAFRNTTSRIEEIVGTIRGIKVTVVDTPGLLPSHGNQRQNRKVLHAIRRYIRRSPVDVVLYFEQLDHLQRGQADYPLLQLITDTFGSSMWLNTLLVLTHSCVAPPEGPDGLQLKYDAYTRYCGNVLQKHIQEAVSNTQVQVPVVLIDNHQLFQTNERGDRILPNGQFWISRLILLCAATKALNEANNLLKLSNTFHLSLGNERQLSLPHLLSSFLIPHSLSSPGADETNDISNNDEDDDEYDQLPPIRVLTKTQYEKLSKDQKKAYLDELDYRETLYLKKQWKEEIKNRKKANVQQMDDSSGGGGYEDDPRSQEVLLLSDMAMPLSFDSECSSYKYRYIQLESQWVLRPVLDPQGWDHDVGIDGINFEASHSVMSNMTTSIAGQITSDKDDFTIQSVSMLNFVDLKGYSLHGGIDIQTASKQLLCSVHGDAKLRWPSWNTPGAGITVTKFGKKYFFGAKVEDSIRLWERLRLMANVGQISSDGRVAEGGSFEVTLNGKDYPVREEKVSLAASIVSFEKEAVIGGKFQSNFQVTRGSKVVFSAKLNSRNLGQVCLKTSTTDHIEIALVALASLIGLLFRRRSSC